MSNKPTAKFWGAINKKNLDQVLSLDSAITSHEKYGDQIKVDAAQWDGGNISIKFYHKETNSNIDLLTLRPQKDGTYSVQSNNSSNVTEEIDSPF